MHNNPQKILIIGGGPAGLAAAINLASKNHSIILCDKQSFPINKACGEGVLPHGVAALQRLGILSKLNSQSYYPFKGIRYISSQGTQAQAEFKHGYGLGINREVLSQALFNQATEYGNIHIAENTKITGFTKHNHLYIASSNKNVDADIIIGADGLHSKTRQWAQFTSSTSSLKRYGITQHYRIKPWSDYVEVYWNKGFEAYITPLSPHSIGVAFLWNKSLCKFDEKLSPSQRFEYFLEKIPLLHTRLKNAETIGNFQGAGPLHQIVSGPIKNNVVLIGDAAGYLDALTGEGISLSLLQAEYLAHVSLNDYLSHYKKLKRRYHILTKAALLAARYPWVAQGMVAYFRKNKFLFELAIDRKLCELYPQRSDLIINH